MFGLAVAHVPPGVSARGRADAGHGMHDVPLHVALHFMCRANNGTTGPIFATLGAPPGSRAPGSTDEEQ